MDDIRSYFDASSSKSTPTDVCSTDTESDSDTDHLQSKKLCTASIQCRAKCRPQASKRNYNTKTQLKELTSHEMLVTMFPNLSALANICMSLPVSTASVERSFSQMKMIITRLRNRIGESSLNHLMLIAIESHNELNDNELDCIVNVWNEKPRRIVV